MNRFNLNIDNYNITELKNLLNLPLNINLTDQHIQFSIENLKEKLLKEKNLDSDNREKIIFFLDNVEIKLQNSISNSNSNTNSFNKNNIEQYGSQILIKDNNQQNAISNTTTVASIPKGIINPIKIKTIKKSINIDSKFRSEYYNTKSSNFSITLPDRINKIATMKIDSVEMPISFYAISPNLENTTFLIKYSSASYPIILPAGNYEQKFSDKTKSAWIENAINDAIKLAAPSLNIKYTIDIVSGKSIFASTNNAEKFEIIFNVNNKGTIDNSIPLMFRLGWLLGFRSANYTGEVAVSEGICLISGPRYIFIAIDDYQNNSHNNFVATYSESILSSHIMDRVSIANLLSSSNRIYRTSDFGSTDSKKREYFGPVDIQRLTITLYDEYGRILDLNNMDWSLVLEFECIYD